MELLTIDQDRRVYHYSDRGGKKYTTWDYVWRKTYGAWRELAMKGGLRENFIAPDAANVGTPNGWQDYLRVMNEVQGWLDITGEPLECMLASEWRDYEGRLVTCRDTKGRRHKFYVLRFGDSIPYYIASKNGGAFGKRLENGAGWHDIELVEGAPPHTPKGKKPSKPAFLSDDDFKRMILERLEALENRLESRAKA